jgi:hypothetical protein
MRIGVCGVACEICPKMKAGTCPNVQKGGVPRENKFCAICDCARRRGVRYCFDCADFPCAKSGEGPISLGFCQHISGKG